MSAARFFQIIAGNGQKREREDQDIIDEKAVTAFMSLDDNVKWKTLKTMWKQGQIKEVLSLCGRNDGLKYFCKHFRNEGRGGVLGALLESTNPTLRRKKFPYLSYLVLKFPETWKPFAMDLSKNPSLTWEVVLFGNQSDFQFDWTYISKNPCVTPKIVQENIPLFKRFWYSLASNPNFTLCELEYLFVTLLDIPFSNDIKSMAVQLTRAYLEQNVDSLDYTLLSENDGIANHIDFVQKHLDKPWIWISLTWKFDWNVILEKADLPWNRLMISERFRLEKIKRKNYTLDELQANESPLVAGEFAAYSNQITWEDIRLEEGYFRRHFANLVAKKQDVDL